MLCAYLIVWPVLRYAVVYWYCPLHLRPDGEYCQSNLCLGSLISIEASLHYQDMCISIP